MSKNLSSVAVVIGAFRVKVCKMYFLNAKQCTVDPDQTTPLKLNFNFRTMLIIKSPLQLCDPV